MLSIQRGRGRPRRGRYGQQQGQQGYYAQPQYGYAQQGGYGQPQYGYPPQSYPGYQ